MFIFIFVIVFSYILSLIDSFIYSFIPSKGHLKNCNAQARSCGGQLFCVRAMTMGKSNEKKLKQVVTAVFTFSGAVAAIHVCIYVLFSYFSYSLLQCLLGFLLFVPLD